MPVGEVVRLVVTVPDAATAGSHLPPPFTE